MLGGRDPWCSGYGRILMYQRSWVQIPAQFTGRIFFTYICYKNCNVCLKVQKWTKKRPGIAHFLKINALTIQSSWQEIVTSVSRLKRKTNKEIGNRSWMRKNSSLKIRHYCYYYYYFGRSCKKYYFFDKIFVFGLFQRKLTYCKVSITVQLNFCFTCLDLAALHMFNNNIFTCLVKSNLSKQEVSCTMILPL